MLASTGRHMDPPALSDEEKCVVQQALRKAGFTEEAAAALDDAALGCLHRGGYRSDVLLKAAQRPDLERCNLPPAYVGFLLSNLSPPGASEEVSSSVKELAEAPADLSKHLVSLLLPQPLHDLPAVDSLEAYLHDMTGMQLPVSRSVYQRAVAVDPSLKPHLNVVGPTVESPFCSFVDAFLEAPDLPVHTELDVTFRAVSLFPDFLGRLSLYESRSPKLDFTYKLNDRWAGASSPSMGAAIRPASSLIVEGALLLVGEAKVEEHSEAMADLESKLGMLPADCYGTLPYILAFTAADTTIRLYAYSALGVASKDLAGNLNFQNLTHRIKMLLLAAKVHALLHLLWEGLPSQRPRISLFEEQGRGNGVSVQALPSCFVKTIGDFSTYAATFGVQLPTLQRAYEAAKACQNLPQAIVPPTLLNDSAGRPNVYMVTQARAGVPTTPTTLQDVQQDICLALAALHASDIVHRDVRWANIAWDLLRHCHVLLDLESAAEPGPLPAGRRAWPYSWPAAVGPDNVYDQASDLYQLGEVIQTLLISIGPASGTGGHDAQAAYDLVAKLKARLFTQAKDALHHPWLLALGSSVSSTTTGGAGSTAGAAGTAGSAGSTAGKAGGRAKGSSAGSTEGTAGAAGTAGTTGETHGRKKQASSDGGAAGGTAGGKASSAGSTPGKARGHRRQASSDGGAAGGTADGKASSAGSTAGVTRGKETGGRGPESAAIPSPARFHAPLRPMAPGLALPRLVAVRVPLPEARGVAAPCGFAR